MSSIFENRCHLPPGAGMILAKGGHSKRGEREERREREREREKERQRQRQRRET